MFESMKAATRTRWLRVLWRLAALEKEVFKGKLQERPSDTELQKAAQNPEPEPEPEKKKKK